MNHIVLTYMSHILSVPFWSWCWHLSLVLFILFEILILGIMNDFHLKSKCFCMLWSWVIGEPFVLAVLMWCHSARENESRWQLCGHRVEGQFPKSPWHLSMKVSVCVTLSGPKLFNPKPKFDLQNPNCERRKPSHRIFPLVSTCTPWHCMHDRERSARGLYSI